jgi:hypothetical protein
MLKEEDKDNKWSVFGFVSYIINLVTFKSKSKAFNVDSIINSLITSLLTLSLYNNHSFYSHLTTSPSYNTLVLLVITSSNRNKWLYDTRVSEHVINDLSQFNIYKECEDLLVIAIMNGLVHPFSIRTISLDCSRLNDKNTTLTLFNVIYMLESLLNLLLNIKLIITSNYACDNKLLLKDDRELY